MSPAEVTACLVTRGDVDLAPILDSLIFENVVVWNNAQRPQDVKTAGRYFAVLEATTPAVYFQDDDVIVPPATQRALLDAYEPGMLVTAYAHTETPDGYDDTPLVHGGAVVDRHLPWGGLNRYLERWPLDDDFLYECDFITGALSYPMFKSVHLPFRICMEVAQHPSRMCNQPWQRDLKREITDRARAIRDEQKVAA